MSSSLKELLGFKGRHFSGFGLEGGQRPVDVCQGFYSIFLYCDIHEARIVGENLVPLLSVLPVEGNSGDIVYRRYEKLHYHVIQKKNVSDIRISLRNDQGEVVPFGEGKVLVTLHFRKLRLSII